MDEEEDTLQDVIPKKKVVKNFNDADKSYRDLQIKTVLAILIDNEYDNLDGDFQWCIETMLKLGVYKSPRINKLLAETLRQLFIELDDTNRKLSVEKAIKTFLNSVTSKKEVHTLNFSNEFFEMLCYIISQNSFSVGAINSAKILEYLRKYSEVLTPTLTVSKFSLCEMMFKLSIIELQNNVNKGWEADIIQDRLKLIRTLITETEFMGIYLDILSTLTQYTQSLSESGSLKEILDYIRDLEQIFNEDLIIGGSKAQSKIEAPS